MRILLLVLFCGTLFAEPSVSQKTYFDGTEHELKVYTISGKIKSPTILIVGGIHGDERSTITVAESYVHSKLRKGTIISVPRANPPAIKAFKRMLNHDMNRLFGANNASTEGVYEQKIANVLKELVRNSDIVLNLHEGRGFYGRTNSGMGQSIVVDDKKLIKKAKQVISIVNKKIEDEQQYFMLNYHDTDSHQTQYPEQKKSLTYYSYYTAKKAAFGVEVSSDLQDVGERTVLLKKVVDTFLNIYGIK